MKITSIKQQVKSQNRVSIFIDDKYSFSLTLDQLLENKLKKGLELDEANIKEFKLLSDEGKLKQRAIEWLMLRPHSQKELRDYLYKKKTEKDLIEAVVQEFVEKNYLDDKKFAIWFAEQRQRKNKSAREVRSELMSKGIKQDLINQVLEEIDINDQESLKMLIEKLRSRTKYKDEKKLKAYLMSKGFRYTDIKELI